MRFNIRHLIVAMAIVGSWLGGYRWKEFRGDALVQEQYECLWQAHKELQDKFHQCCGG